MTDRHRPVIREALAPRIRYRTLHKRSRDGIWSIEHNHFNSRTRRGLQKISQCRFVGIEPHPSVLDIEDDGLQLLHHVRRRTARGVLPPIHAVDRNSGCCICRIANFERIQGSGHTVLWTEDRIQRNSRRLGKYINNPPSVCIHPGLVGQYPNPLLAAGNLQYIEAMLFQHIDTSLDAPIAYAHTARGALSLVVAGNTLPAKCFFFARSQRQCCCNGRRHF